jgi:hypothetical protein
LLPSPTTANFRPSPYDETLLAVIGVLDHIRQESNVAGWIRSRGLWAGLERDVVRPENGSVRNGSEAEVKEAGTEVEFVPVENNEVDLGEEDIGPEADRLETRRENKKEKKTKGRHRKHRKKRRKIDGGDEEDLHSAEVTERERDDVEAQPEAVNTTTTTTSDTMSSATTSTTSPSTLGSAAPMKTTTTSFISTTTSIDTPTDSQIHTAWFTNPANLAYWVSKGRQAIRRLGIKEEVGIS